MRRTPVMIVAALALAACGADGEPRPKEPAAAPGLQISGTARIGVSVSSSGVHPAAQIGLRRGPVTMSAGF